MLTEVKTLYLRMYWGERGVTGIWVMLLRTRQYLRTHTHTHCHTHTVTPTHIQQGLSEREGWCACVTESRDVVRVCVFGWKTGWGRKLWCQGAPLEKSWELKVWLERVELNRCVCVFCCVVIMIVSEKAPQTRSRFSGTLSCSVCLRETQPC